MYQHSWHPSQMLPTAAALLLPNSPFACYTVHSHSATSPIQPHTHTHAQCLATSTLLFLRTLVFCVMFYQGIAHSHSFYRAHAVCADKSQKQIVQECCSAYCMLRLFWIKSCTRLVANKVSPLLKHPWGGQVPCQVRPLSMYHSF